ncbi:MAG: RNA recognition motif domain-containing protein [Bacteriovoracaceae bacterium]
MGSSKKLFIGGLSWNTTNESLLDAFSKYGETTECKVVMDRVTGKSKGFGFVAFESQSAADAGLEGMANQMLDGRTIKVDYATEKPASERAPRSNNFSGRY